MIKPSDLRKKNKEELQEELKKLKGELNDVVLEVVKGKEKNLKKTGNIKRDIARVSTVLNEKLFMQLQEGKNE